MVQSVSTLRAQDYAECAYLLAIEGLPYMWVTEHPNGALLGSGDGSWIHHYESNASSPEVAGERTVKPGLMMPRSVDLGRLELKTGILQKTTTTFTLIDYDGTLLSLFATEGKDYEIVTGRIAPGTSAVTSVQCKTGSQSTLGKHIGLEKFGPSGQRRQFPAFPFPAYSFQTPVGFEHDAGNGGESDPLIRLSDDPLDFTGRLVALYRLYRDPSMDPTYLSWPRWDLQYDSGALVWWGTLRDRGELVGHREWKITCGGPESLLRRRLGTRSPTEPIKLDSASFELAESERKIALSFYEYGYNPSVAIYQGVEFSSSFQLSASGTIEDMRSEINTFIQDALSGSNTNYNVGETTADSIMDMGLRADNTIWIRRTANDGLGALAYIALSEKVWRYLGFEPNVQRNLEVDDEQYCGFSGEATVAWPSGYKSLVVATHRGSRAAMVHYKRELFGVEGDYDNAMKPQYWRPLYAGGIGILNRYGRQEITFGFNHVYLDGQRTIPYSATASVGGSSVEKARICAFRGKIAVGKIRADGDTVAADGEDVDEEETIQVARCSWWEVGHANVGTNSSQSTAIYLEDWLDPREYGFDHDKLSSEWAYRSGGIEILPLNAYAYGDDRADPPLENAGSVFTQILLSTGTATGYSSGLENAPIFSLGDNTGEGVASYAFSQLYGGDCEIADLGLGIPHPLVDTVDNIRQVFDEAGLPRVRYAYWGSFDSHEAIKSLVSSRGLMLTLRGRKYGVARLEPFEPDSYDLDIVEDDLYGTPGDPGSTMPSQSLRAVGQLDKTKFSFNRDPIGGSFREKQTVLAKDSGARFRGGDLELSIAEHGLRYKVRDIERIWGTERPRYFAQRHMLVNRLKISRIKGQDIHIGTRLLITNPWIVAPTSSGYDGVTKAAALVTNVRLSPEEHAYEIDCLVFAGQFGTVWRYFAPVGRIRRITGTTVELYPDSEFLGHGQGDDANRMWTEPSHSELGGDATVGVWEYDRGSWSLTATSTVTAVDTANNRITLGSAFSPAPKRDTDKLLLFVTADSQAAAWVNTLGLPIVLDDHTYGSGPTEGSPFNDRKDG